MPRPLPGSVRRYVLFAVKAVHSLAFLVIQSAILLLIFLGVRGQTDRRAALAFGIAAGESLIYAGNGFRCPLTGLAEDLGAESGAVTDIFLPRWLASNIARIYTPLFVIGIALHLRNIVRARAAASPE